MAAYGLIETPTQTEAIADAVQSILGAVGEDPVREGLRRTPERAAKAWGELTAGMNLTLAAVLNGAIFTQDYGQVEAAHFCMMMRGVEKQHSTTATWAFLGEFRENTQLRNEFMAAINSRQA